VHHIRHGWYVLVRTGLWLRLFCRQKLGQLLREDHYRPVKYQPNKCYQYDLRVVSTFKRDSLVLLTRSSTTCTVDDQGVFAAVSFTTRISVVPGGVRFNPGGGGSWSNISFPVNYGWQNSIQSNVLFNLKSPTGSNQLVHALVGATPGAIAFATLSTGSPYHFGSTASWLMISGNKREEFYVMFSLAVNLFL